MPGVASSSLESVPVDERTYLVQFRGATTCDPAFEQLYRLHHRAVRAWILRIVRNPSAADELTIETFWRIYRTRDRFQPEYGFQPWARRIATRAAFDWLRSHKSEYALGDAFLSGIPAQPRTDPAISDEIRRKLAQAFARLHPGLRIAAALAVIEERPHKEVADALGISVAAVKLRVFRALRKLRKDLQRQGITP